jgi:hypothetical protein
MFIKADTNARKGRAHTNAQAGIVFRYDNRHHTGPPGLASLRPSYDFLSLGETPQNPLVSLRSGLLTFLKKYVP